MLSFITKLVNKKTIVKLIMPLIIGIAAYFLGMNADELKEIISETKPAQVGAEVSK